MERRKEFGPDEQHLLFLFFPDYTDVVLANQVLRRADSFSSRCQVL